MSLTQQFGNYSKIQQGFDDGLANIEFSHAAI